MTPATAVRPTVAVIVCAYTIERLDDLTACFAALHRQSAPPNEIVCVVDGNPDLATTLHRLVAANGWTVRVVENTQTPGLSGARNTGVEATTAELALFIDDDAVPASDWVEELVDPFTDPRTAAAGGRIDPGWPDRRPAWFPPHLDWTIGCSIPTLPAEGGPIRNMYGASAAFRRSALETAGGFPTELGRVGANGAGCEETELCIRIRQDAPDAQVMYAPRSRVTHRVTPERATVGYILRRCLAEGRSKAVLGRRVGADVATSDERGYVVEIARAVISDVAAVVTAPRRIGRAAVLVAGLASAAIGYSLEGMRRR